jgi:hypothetical protein
MIMLFPVQKRSSTHISWAWVVEKNPTTTLLDLSIGRMLIFTRIFLKIVRFSNLGPAEENSGVILWYEMLPQATIWMGEKRQRGEPLST